MTEKEIYQLKYPIGEFNCPTEITMSIIDIWITDISLFPERIIALTNNLTSQQKLFTYRPGSWNVRQIVHHCSDSHLNSLIRFKWALTEDKPTIKTYDENEWIKLNDSNTDSLENTYTLLQGLHAKWAFLLKSLSQADLDRIYIHPEQGREITIKETIGMYAWHCNHHLAQIKQAIESNGKYNS